MTHFPSQMQCYPGEDDLAIARAILMLVRLFPTLFTIFGRSYS